MQSRVKRGRLLARGAFATATSLGLLVALGASGQSATVTATTPVSCDMGITKTDFRKVGHYPNGNIWVKQNSSLPVSTTTVWARREGGGSLSAQNVGNGGTVSW